MWLNLPAKYKMTKPFYAGLQKADIPAIAINQKVSLNLIAGNWEGQKGGFEPLTDIFLSSVKFESGGEWQISVPKNRNIFFYVVRGNVVVNDQEVKQRQLAEFNNDDENLDIKVNEDSLIIFGHAEPLNEPMIAQGPFVMNTEQEIIQAYQDYQLGKFGVWKG